MPTPWTRTEAGGFAENFAVGKTGERPTTTARQAPGCSEMSPCTSKSPAFGILRDRHGPCRLQPAVPVAVFSALHSLLHTKVGFVQNSSDPEPNPLAVASESALTSTEISSSTVRVAFTMYFMFPQVLLQGRPGAPGSANHSPFARLLAANSACCRAYSSSLIQPMPLLRLYLRTSSCVMSRMFSMGRAAALQSIIHTG